MKISRRKAMAYELLNEGLLETAVELGLILGVTIVDARASFNKKRVRVAQDWRHVRLATGYTLEQVRAVCRVAKAAASGVDVCALPNITAPLAQVQSAMAAVVNKGLFERSFHAPLFLALKLGR